MERTSNETTSALEHLTEELRELERRVRALEVRSREMLPSAEGSPAEQRTSTSAPVLQPAFGLPSSLSTIGLIPVWGQAVLGIAGAYLLRAAAESGTFSRPIVVAVSIVYATLWLVASSITARSGRKSAPVIYAATGALIFFPMLWETTTQFRVLTPLAAGGLLIAFGVLGSALARLRDLAGVMWVTAVPAAATAMILLVTTGGLAPFVTTLLAICLAVESADAGGHWTGIRPVVAFLADIGVALMIYVAALPRQLETYRPIGGPTAAGLCFGLLAIYAISVGFRTAGSRHGATFFETVQMAVALTLAVGGTLRLTHAAAALGAFCLLGAGGLYGVALVYFDRIAAGRNYKVYASLGLGLLLAGSVLLFSGRMAAMLWSGLAVAAMFASARTARLTLAFHGAICLMASAYVSGLLDYGRLALAGTVAPTLPSLVLWVVTAGAALSYLGCSSEPVGKWPRLAAATLVALAASAFLIAVAARFAGPAPGASWLPTVRTLVICAVALLAGIGGARLPAALTSNAVGGVFSGGLLNAPRAVSSRRIELVWIGYAAMALVTLKLFAQDFRESSPAGLAISLLCYGAVLMFGPRLTRLGTPSS